MSTEAWDRLVAITMEVLEAHDFFRLLEEASAQYELAFDAQADGTP